ncbi:hypothetical protein [Pedobacter sp. ASV12]|uniref:hypothetical protein n=1 Tax=Pedobacter sp. ASV12 TaxID=2795120 RepID=UPI001E35FEB1|nr:hypothetical protein [Pedobacter sp. ASV12]
MEDEKQITRWACSTLRYGQATIHEVIFFPANFQFLPINRPLANSTINQRISILAQPI